jgi:hypothetical protein
VVSRHTTVIDVSSLIYFIENRLTTIFI